MLMRKIAILLQENYSKCMMCLRTLFGVAFNCVKLSLCMFYSKCTIDIYQKSVPDDICFLI